MTQEQAFTIMKTGVNVYLTGSAGSGKTYLLNRYISYLQDHGVPVAVTASTGIAATHMNGMTIHGWSGIGIKETLDERDLQNLEEKKYLWKRFEKAKVLIIDEVSMLHSYRLDMIDKVCRRFKRVGKPFGGLQVILSGDFFQLPPINKNNSSSITENNNDSKNMVFASEAWDEMCPAICYLTEQHRQEDDKMIEILNNIRSNTIKDRHLNYLRERIGAKLGEGEKPTRLYTHNVNVDNENIKELLGIEGEDQFYRMTSSGRDLLVDILKKSCLAHENLNLKIGAEVMFIKNNLESGYVNGTRGVVENFSNFSGNPIVRLYNGKSIEVSPETWAIEEDGKKKASITQIPLRLAWAITIHKSQGMSLDNAEIDLSKTFSYGMGYVALSRVRTLAGVSLIGLHEDALKIDPDVSKFDEFLQKQSEENEELFGKLKNDQREKLENDFLLRVGGTISTSIGNRKSSKSRKINDTKIPTIMITKELLDKGMNIQEIAKERNFTRGTITQHIEQIMKDFPETKIYHIRPKQKDIDLVSKANKQLKGEEVGKLSPIKKILEEQDINMTFEDIRLAKLFI